MNCEITRTFYIKSNGRLLCNDDYGERVELADLLNDTFNPDDLFNGVKYSHIRRSLATGATPWQGICEHCAFLRPNEPFGRDSLSRRVIEKMQVEASLACVLACPACSSSAQMKRREKPFHLPPDLFTSILSNLKRSSYELWWVEYCGQGEPLSNPRFPALIDACRNIYPETKQRLITNGNFDFRNRVGAAIIDEIIVSIDGALQESYEKYRVHGTLKESLKFVEDAVLTRKANGGVVIWKYILLETNDSDEEIKIAQKIANDAGVDTLLFVLSNSIYKSKRYTHENFYEIPILYPNIVVNAHPHFFKDEVVVHASEPLSRASGSTDVLLHVDSLQFFRRGFVMIVGWALAFVEIQRIDVLIADSEIATAALGMPRLDVIAVHSNYTNERSGFRAACRAPKFAPQDTIRVEFIVYGTGQELARFVTVVSTADDIAATPNRTTEEIEEKLKRLGCDPIEGMAKIAMDENAPLPIRAAMFKELASYIAPKRKAIE